MVDKIKEEVNEMLDEFFPGDEGIPKEDPPVEDPPVEDPPKEEPPVEEPPKEEPLKEEPPIEEPPMEEPPEEEPLEETPEEELARLRDQNKLLLERVEAGYEPPPVKGEPPKEEPPKKEEPLKKETPPSEPIDFVGDKTLEEVLDTKEGLNAFLNEVAKRLAPKGDVDMEPVVERILTALPKIVQTQVTQQTAINELVADFYRENEDLLSARRTVGIYANEVHSENPDWETKKVFEEAGIRTRKALGMREKALRKERQSRSPGFASNRGARGRKGVDTRTELAKDIDDLVT